MIKLGIIADFMKDIKDGDSKAIRNFFFSKHPLYSPKSKHTKQEKEIINRYLST